MRTSELRDRIGSDLWLTDGGLETVMVFLEGLDLPQFAAFPLVGEAKGRAALTRYFEGMLDLARDLDRGFILDTPTWRASAGWGPSMGMSADEIDAANRAAVAFCAELRAGRPGQAILLEGVIGPHGDAFAPDRLLSADEAQDYHARQIGVLADAGVDMISALTLSSPDDAIGIARAAQDQGCPVTLSFTVETDGRLRTGMPLSEAIARTDAETGAYPAWYGINCAHPSHFRDELKGAWLSRLGAIRANASQKSHAELDAAADLDDGDPQALAEDYRALSRMLPALHVLGGCCGTDLRHVTAIGHACRH